MARDKWIEKQFEQRQTARIRDHKKKAFRSGANAAWLDAQIRARSQRIADNSTNPHSELAADMVVAYSNVTSFLEQHPLPANQFSKLHTLQNAWLNRTDQSFDSISTDPEINRFIVELQYEKIVSALSRPENDETTLDQLAQLLQSFIRLRDRYRSQRA